MYTKKTSATPNPDDPDRPGFFLSIYVCTQLFPSSFLCLHTVLVSQPQVAASAIQSNVPAHQLGQGDAEFLIDQVAVVASDYRVPFLAIRGRAGKDVGG